MPGVLRGDRVHVEDPAEASQLYNKGYFGDPQSGGGLALTLLEAAYLLEAGRLEVRRRGRRADLGDILRLGHGRMPTFDIKYLVYRDLRQRGYIVKDNAPPFDFRVFPRGGGPSKTPSRYWVAALSERALFRLDDLIAVLDRTAGARKRLLLAVVDEESDLTYYAVREATPRGRARGPRRPRRLATAHFLEDRAMVLDKDEARALHEAGFYGKMVGERLHLSLLEAAYLRERGLIEVRNADTNRAIGLARLLREARRIQPDFDLRLRAYQDLKDRGIVVKTGFKYGSHFRGYEGDPETTHAKYLVHALPARFEGMWPEISRAVRLAHGVKKQILFGRVDEDVTYVRIERVRP
jgi:tRNA-intron endonuclease